MKLFKSKTTREWEAFLRTADNQELIEEKNKLHNSMMELRDKKKEIQIEQDRRNSEQVPVVTDKDQEIYS